MRIQIVRWLIVVVALLGVGCATTSGAPRKPYDMNHAKDLTADTALFVLLQQGITKDDRNKEIFTALAVVDLRYNEFRQRLAGDRKHTSSISDALTLAMTVAGSLTDSAGVKENYLQGIALLTGGMSIYDKNYLQSQTITALIAQMDANRTKKLTEILASMDGETKTYPGYSAYNDVISYYQCGTLLGAVMGIQADAKTKEKDAQTQIPALMQQLN